MSDLSDILSSAKYKQPEEISLIKKFIRDNFDENAGVEVTKNTIIISVNSASLANALRLKILELERFVNTNKKLIIRIV